MPGHVHEELVDDAGDRARRRADQEDERLGEAVADAVDRLLRLDRAGRRDRVGAGSSRRRGFLPAGRPGRRPLGRATASLPGRATSRNDAMRSLPRLLRGVERLIGGA